MSKIDSLNKLYLEYGEKFKEYEVVLGEGNVDSKILLIGEAPGRDEVKLKRPFVGMAGKNLSEFLRLLNLKKENIYISNAIKYRLSKLNVSTGRIINRPATYEDIEESRRFLIEEIGILNPEYIITLGAVSLKAISGRTCIKMFEEHGKLEKIFINKNEYYVYPLYHPASIIYNRSLREVYIDDLNKLSKLFKDKL